jgi:hypothetical protein
MMKNDLTKKKLPEVPEEEDMTDLYLHFFEMAVPKANGRKTS